MLQDKERLERILSQDLGLTPYESKAYIALIMHGPMSPSDLNQKAGIPRPRTYDVLNSLIGKGLLQEQPSRPPIYAAMEPKQGLKNLLLEIEREALTVLEEKRRIVDTVSESLASLYTMGRENLVEKDRVWVTRRDTAFIARYVQAIKILEKELLVLSSDTKPPEKEVLEAVKAALKENKTIRVIRRITRQWTLKDIEDYEEYIKLGSQVRYLDEINVRYSIFDKKEILFTLPENEYPRTALVAVWVKNPSLAEILCEHFERLWKLSQPALPILENLKKTKLKEANKKIK